MVCGRARSPRTARSGGCRCMSSVAWQKACPPKLGSYDADMGALVFVDEADQDCEPSVEFKEALNNYANMTWEQLDTAVKKNMAEMRGSKKPGRGKARGAARARRLVGTEAPAGAAAGRGSDSRGAVVGGAVGAR
eukprot:9496343-Pyramimonas_sp.AAC.2